MVKSFFFILFFISFIICGGGWDIENQNQNNNHLQSRYCSGAGSCGSVLQTFNGIYAYSNGMDQCTGYSCNGYGTYGYQYQCVELAQRYFSLKYGTTPIWYANAIDMCDTHPSNVYQTSNPQPGDLIVLDIFPPYGHVAVITSVNSGQSVNVIEQNSAISGSNIYAWNQAYCFLTTNQTVSSNSTCAGAADGYYCGNNGISGSPNTLYLCSNGQVASTQQCQVCETFPSGYNDKCTSGSCSNLENGYYCGDDMVNGDDPNALYLCSNDNLQSASHCLNGCITAPAGTADYCA